MRDFLLRRARSPALFFLLAVLLFLAAFLLARTARSADEEAAALRTQNDAAEAFASTPTVPRTAPLYFPAGEFLALGDAIRQSGASVQEISEEPPEPMTAGEVLKMKVAGHGTFPQVLSLFDIIHMKKHWVRADLLRLARDGDRLSFELELSAYRSRGTYEEEKHRTDRSDGHRQEPGGKDTR